MGKFIGSIRYKLLYIMLIVSFVVASIGYVTFISWYVADKYENKINLSETVTNVLSQNFAKVIYLDSVREANDITTILKSYPEIQKVILYNNDGKVVYTYNRNNKPIKLIKFSKNQYVKKRGEKLEISKRVVYQDIKLGYLIMEIKIESIWDILIDDLPLLFITAIVLFIVSLLLSFYYSKDFTKPILKLVAFLRGVDLSKEKVQNISLNGYPDEFNLLYGRVNSMLSKIKESNEAQRIASVAFEIENGMVITDKRFKILRVNRAYSNMTGYKEEDITGKIPPVLKHKLEEKSFYKQVIKSLGKYHFWSGDLRNIKKDGTIFLIHLSIQAVVSTNNKITHYIFSFLDITKQKEMESRLRYLQDFDSLTGLPNKKMVTKMICKDLSSHNGAFLYISITNFKEINEMYGYDGGDMLLKDITNRIKKEFTRDTVVGKMDGSKFLIYRSYKENEDDIVTKSKLDSEVLISILSKPFYIEGKEVYIFIAVGISLHKTHDKLSTTILLNHAENALANAKKEREKIFYFDKSIQKKAIESTTIFTNILKALINKDFILYYQLQYDKFKKPYAAEALIRWNDPEKGMISPASFIPIAEETGLITKIGKEVIELACKQINKWGTNPLLKDIVVSINIGARHFKEDDFVEQIKTIFDKYKTPYNKAKLEITEYVMVDNLDIVAKKLQTLRELGFKISLDDFGTGFSSLQYLRELPIDQVKIDQKFVLNMKKNRKDIEIIKSIISLGKALDIEVIAEGVEELSHYEILKNMGCDFFQGYHFAKPKNPEDIEKLENFLKQVD